MTVQEAILKIHAPKGVTTVLAGVMSGDYSVLKEHDGLSASLSTAQEMVDKHQKQLNECQSDWAYWGILGDLTYWEAVRNILEAGTLNGGVLADVPGPYLEGLVVMDSIGKVGDFGKEVLSKTKQLVAILYDDTPEKERPDYINNEFKKVSKSDLKSALREVNLKNKEIRDSYEDPTRLDFRIKDSRGFPTGDVIDGAKVKVDDDPIIAVMRIARMDNLMPIQRYEYIKSQFTITRKQ